MNKFKVTYNYQPHIFDDNGKYLDGDTYTISYQSYELVRNDVDSNILNSSTNVIRLTVNREQLEELLSEIDKAVKERDDVRGFHE